MPSISSPPIPKPPPLVRRRSMVEGHLLVDEGEIIIDEVRHHWVVYIRTWLQAAGVALLLYGALMVQVQVAWFFLAAATALGLYTAYLAAYEYRDRFVITNMRVMRVRGVFAKKLATTPISRILDITVDKPFIGRLFGYGHFVFESAAQEQGFREIRYVGHPDQRDLTIQRVIQRAGLRSLVSFDDDGSGDTTERAPEPARVGAGRGAGADDDTGPIEVRRNERVPEDRPRANGSSRRRGASTIFNSDNPRWDEHPRPR